jgi:ribosomal protein S18 acetylase RimI-like enzyme
MEVNLRPATPADAAALAKMHVASWHQAYRGIVPDSHLQEFTAERQTERFCESLASHAEETYVAESGGQVLGFLTLGDCRDPNADRQTTGEIWGIYLSPDHWRKGIGRFLCTQSENMLVSRGCSFATLWVLEANDQARRFYEAMGFATDGETKQVELGAPLTAIRYRKELKSVAPTVGGGG